MQGKTKLRWLCASALICLTALVAASPAAAELSGENSPLLPNTGNIRGTVTENGVPVEELEVCAITEQSEPYGFVYCARTEEGGQYLIFDVPEQGYKVWVQSLTYLAGWPQGYPQQYYPGVKHYEEATWVPVHGEGTTTGIDFQVHKGGQISGTVTAEDTGEPVAGVKVCPTWASGAERAEEPFCSITDAAGEYLIQNVDTGEYTLKFDTQWNPEYEHYSYPQALEFDTAWYQGAASLAEADPVSVTAGQTTEGIDAELTRVGGHKSTPAPPSTEPSGGSGQAGATPGSGSQGGAPGAGPSNPMASGPTLTFGAASPTRLACKRGFRKATKGRQARCVKVRKQKAAHPVARLKAHR
jgi:hypothetical protein